MNERPDESGSGVDLKRAAAAAVTAALAGALVGAAKAVVDKRDHSTEPEQDDAPEESTEEDRPEPEDDAAVQDEDDEDEPEQDDESQPEDVNDEREPNDDGEPEPNDDGGQSEQTGASSSDVASIISRAKEHVEAVIGSEAESVSGVERANGNWRVNVEVVQMRRIPESTDILASYGVVLDADGDLISVQELRRYRRSHAEDER